MASKRDYYEVLGGAKNASEDDIKKHVKSILAGSKVPRDITFLDELPRNPTGKVLKKELRDATEWGDPLR